MIGQVAQRYAEALYDLARRQGVLEQVSTDVAALGRETAQDQVAAFLVNPRIERAERQAKLAAVTGGFHQLTQNFVSLCFDKGREAVLCEVAEAFRLRQLDEAGIVEGVVESARPLDSAEVDRLAAHLGTRLGKTVQLDNRVRADLVGGFRVTVGSSMIDATVQGRLEDLRDRLLTVPLA